jgi:hypothetical protein
MMQLPIQLDDGIDILDDVKWVYFHVFPCISTGVQFTIVNGR